MSNNSNNLIRGLKTPHVQDRQKRITLSKYDKDTVDFNVMAEQVITKSRLTFYLKV